MPKKKKGGKKKKGKKPKMIGNETPDQVHFTPAPRFYAVRGRQPGYIVE